MWVHGALSVQYWGEGIAGCGGEKVDERAYYNFYVLVLEHR